MLVPFFLTSTMLQWGRGLSAAETDTERSCGTTWGVLQWGRGLSATETCADALAAPGEVCFNEAAAFWPRKPDRLSRSANSRAGFNGAAAFRPRKQCTSGNTRGRMSFFNGAAAFRPRKLVVGYQRVPAVLSSMGPWPFGRGNLPSESTEKTLIILQWGRGLSAAETRSSYGL